MKTNYVLIDYENVQVKSLALLQGEQFRVRVFLGPKNTKVPVELAVAMQMLGSRAEYVVLEAAGSNALDFHIAYYLGVLAVADPAGFFHVISKDTGFDPLIKHLKARKISAARSVAIEEMPCFGKAEDKQNKAEAGAPKACDTLLRLAVDDLIKRKDKKPGTVKTLRSTIHARCGKNLPESDIDAVWEVLIKRSYVTVNGEKVSYTLPTAAPAAKGG